MDFVNKALAHRASHCFFVCVFVLKMMYNDAENGSLESSAENCLFFSRLPVYSMMHEVPIIWLFKRVSVAREKEKCGELYDSAVHGQKNVENTDTLWAESGWLGYFLVFVDLLNCVHKFPEHH